MADAPSEAEPTYSLFTYYRHTAPTAGATTRRQLLIRQSDDPVELLDLARELVRLHLVYEIFLSPSKVTTDIDDDLLASWVQLAVEALKEKGPLETRLLA